MGTAKLLRAPQRRRCRVNTGEAATPLATASRGAITRASTSPFHHSLGLLFVFYLPFFGQALAVSTCVRAALATASMLLRLHAITATSTPSNGVSA